MLQDAWGAGGTVLIVEDDADIREALRDALEGAGYAIRLARNGKEGLEVLAGMERPCLILLDLMMPVMNGLEFLENLRGSDETAGIPVVLVSAYDRVAAQADAQGFLRKPVDLDHLLGTVARFCAAPSA